MKLHKDQVARQEKAMVVRNAPFERHKPFPHSVMSRDAMERCAKKEGVREILSVLETGKMERPSSYREKYESPMIPEDMQEKLAERALRKRKRQNLVKKILQYSSLILPPALINFGYNNLVASVSTAAVFMVLNSIWNHFEEKNHLMLEISDVLRGDNITSDKARATLQKMHDHERNGEYTVRELPVHALKRSLVKLCEKLGICETVQVAGSRSCLALPSKKVVDLTYQSKPQARFTIQVADHTKDTDSTQDEKDDWLVANKGIIILYS